MNSWWLIFFILGCYVCYEYGLRRQEQDFAKLSTIYRELQAEKSKAHIQHQNLLLQINSQDDPDWVEVVLMKKLGVVPEGQTKVLFTEK